ncbi:MAG: hypothetical protein JXQ87_19140 [Bacteroidia bacterium]
MARIKNGFYLSVLLFAVAIVSCKKSKNNNERIIAQIEPIIDSVKWVKVDIEPYNELFSPYSEPKLMDVPVYKTVPKKVPEYQNFTIETTECQPIIRNIGDEHLAYAKDTIIAPVVTKASYANVVDANEGIRKADAYLDFESFTSGNGLPTSNITCLYKDSKSTLWIGTQNEGLIAFNGEYFQIFSIAEGFVNGGITGITEDRSGNIWINFTDKFIRFDGSSFFTYYIDSEVYNGAIKGSSIVEDDLGAIWATSRSNSLVRFFNDTLTFYPIQHITNSDAIYTLHCDGSNRLWMGLVGGGLAIMEDEKISLYSNSTGFVDKYVMDIYESQDGTVWLANWTAGLSSFDINTRTITTLNKITGQPFIRILDITEDENGALWCATQDGIYHITDKMYIHYKKEHGLVSNNVHDLVYDEPAKNLFSAHMGSGIGVLNYNGFRSFGEHNGFTNDIIETFVHNDYKYYRTTKFGIIRENNSNLQFIGNPKTNRLRTFDSERDSNNFLWVSTKNRGLLKIRGDKFYHLMPKHGYPTDISRLEYDHDAQRMIATTNKEMLLYTKLGLTKYDLSGLMSKSGEITGLTKAANGNILMTVSGDPSILKFDGKNIWQFRSEKLKGVLLKSIEVDKQNNIWFSIYGSGLYCIHNNSLFRFNTRNGITSDRISFCAIDDSGNPWIGSNLGIDQLEVAFLNNGNVEYNKWNYNTRSGFKEMAALNGRFTQE